MGVFLCRTVSIVHSQVITRHSYFVLLKFRALKCLENKGFVSRGLKKFLIFGAANFSVKMCVVVKRQALISIC